MTAHRDAPRASVVVRTRNRPGLLAEALDSLRAQTFQDFETILVNDGDAVPPELLDPPPGRGLATVVPPAPGGRTRALNAGLAAARGTYVAYLDDDDLFLPDHLETLVRFLDGSDEYRVAYTSVRQVEQVLGEDGRYRGGREITVYGRTFDGARLLYKNDIPLIALVHRRALVDETGPFDETFDEFEDWDFLIRLSEKTRFHHIPRVTAVYRLRDDASNLTAAHPWHSADAQLARRRVFEKHAGRRSVATELSLVDGLEADFYAMRDAAAAARADAAAARGEAAAARAEADGLRAEIAAVRAALDAETTASNASARREEALAVEVSHLKTDLAKAEDAIRSITASRSWRLMAPLRALKGLFAR